MPSHRDAGDPSLRSLRRRFPPGDSLRHLAREAFHTTAPPSALAPSHAVVHLPTAHAVAGYRTKNAAAADATVAIHRDHLAPGVLFAASSPSPLPLVHPCGSDFFKHCSESDTLRSIQSYIRTRKEWRERSEEVFCSAPRSRRGAWSPADPSTARIAIPSWRAALVRPESWQHIRISSSLEHSRFLINKVSIWHAIFSFGLLSDWIGFLYCNLLCHGKIIIQFTW
uniref:Uncharacterized protein n=1 Tax=Oryza barthii TaxID=65489 RepID=A0A0D3HCP9_9ORYZ